MSEPSCARVGLAAPSFRLGAATSVSSLETVALEDYRGRWLVLVFYPRDFSLVCPTELTTLSARLPELQAREADVLGVSVDDPQTHQRWIRAAPAKGGLGGLRFPLASDPDGAVARAYGVWDDAAAVCLRALFIIDPASVVRYQVVHSPGIGRGSDEVLRVLAALRTGGICPADWTRRQQPMSVLEQLGEGRVVSSYRLERLIGTGAFAAVWRATDLTLGRQVALKILDTRGYGDAAAVLAEARTAAALDHPAICRLFSVDDSAGVPVIAMELIEGRSLAKVIEEDGPLPPERVRKIMGQVAAGLAAAHAKGVIHGDLKPANVVVTDEDVAKLVDFGFARLDPALSDPDATADFDDTQAGKISGTPSYMTPEQVSGRRTSPASDVFAFGSMIYEALKGRRLIEGRNILEVFSNILRLDGEAVAADLPAPFAEIVRDALVRDESARVLTAEALRTRLES